jgi:hypothetical protein
MVVGARTTRTECLADLPANHNYDTGIGFRCALQVPYCSTSQPTHRSRRTLVVIQRSSQAHRSRAIHGRVRYRPDVSIATYYLAPGGKMAADAFAVIREGMKGKVGIGKLALYGREYLVAVRPPDRGIVIYTLHHAAELRGIDSVEELNSVAMSCRARRPTRYVRAANRRRSSSVRRTRPVPS